MTRRLFGDEDFLSDDSDDILSSYDECRYKQKLCLELLKITVYYMDVQCFYIINEIEVKNCVMNDNNMLHLLHLVLKPSVPWNLLFKPEKKNNRFLTNYYHQLYIMSQMYISKNDRLYYIHHGLFQL